jgi:hypothetical protein
MITLKGYRRGAQRKKNAIEIWISTAQAPPFNPPSAISAALRFCENLFEMFR